MSHQFTTSTECQNLIGTGSNDWTDGNPYKISNLKSKYTNASGWSGGCCAEDCQGNSDYIATAHVLINDARKGGGGNT